MRFIALVTLIMTLNAMPATANNTALPELFDANELSMVGEGEFRFLGFHLYDASYWRNDDGAQALHILYRKNIRGEALNNQMITEWRRLSSAGREQRDDWARQAGSFWPDVSPGDSLTAIVTPGSHTEFFNGEGQLLGRVDDPDFGPAFLDIWLDARSRARRLRTALIGDRG